MADASNCDISSCQICNNLHTSTPLEYGHTLSTILQAANTGCRTCLLVSNAVNVLLREDLSPADVQVGWDTMRIRGRRIVVGTCPDGQFLFSIDLYSNSNNTSWRTVEGVERPRQISGDTGSATAEVLLKQWMADCDSHHQCRRSEGALLPSRLVDVRDPGKVSLYSAEDREMGAYACLSHCWGQAPTLCTTSDNLAAFTNSIPLQALSQVYRDAVAVARKLSIPFLWIDSLCIVQDREEDWLKESAKMANVYSNAVLTIAASRAAGEGDSLFSKAPEEYSSKLLQTMDVSDIYIRKTMDHGHGAKVLPLLTRAWVLQERLLSPRVVHFTDQELIWECMERVTCECGAIRSLWSPGHVPFDKSILYEPLLARLSAQDLQQQWRRLVEEYSRLQLTRDRDKLPAIAGAARRVSEYRSSEYLAGIWRDGLLLDLLWERRGSSENRPLLQGIPSWSWIAADTQILYEDCVATEQLAVVIAASCERSQKGDAFGEIEAGEIELLTTTATLADIAASTKEDALVVVSPDDESLDGSRAPFEIVFDRAETKMEPEMTCARIAVRKGVYRSDSDEEIWLVLVPATSSSRCHRVGMLKVRVNDDNEELEAIRGKAMELIRLV